MEENMVSDNKNLLNGLYDLKKMNLLKNQRIIMK